MQPAATPSQTPYIRVSLFFFLVWLVLTWGFYRTYLIFFPSFTGFKPVQHLHGAIMMTWMGLLIIQPLLIRAGKISIHRLLGKLSYIIAPLVVVSMFLITKFGYYKAVPPMTHLEKVGKLSLQSFDILEFVVFYSLAIVYKRNTYNHMRYMIGTGIIMIGPGLGRGLGVFFHIPFNASTTFVLFAEAAIAAAFLLSDVYRKRSYRANAVVLALLLAHCIFWVFRMNQPWQGIGESIVNYLF
jgi:hypothetical protein